MSRYIKIWIRLTIGAFQVAFISRLGAFLFTFAKILRFTFFLLIVFLVVSQTKSLVGYTLHQSLVFFLTFNVIDTITQLLFRDVYRFRSHIVSGYFDNILAKPMQPLFKILLGGADPLDLVVLIPYLILLVLLLHRLTFSNLNLFMYLLLILNSFIIATGFHILVLALGILTTEVDHTIMIYRDVSSMARFPVDIYNEPLRGFITFIIPVGIMMTYPPKMLFGLLEPKLVLVSFILGAILLLVSLRIWKSSLARYTSASS